MLIIGLTGPTGAGKGMFSQIAVRDFGALHIDTDKVARQVVEPGSTGLATLVRYFGDGILRPDGALDRARLAGIVFTDKEKLAALNKITHPLVTEEVEKHLAKARKENIPFAIIDAPLLFESGEDKICDVTVGIVADESTRFTRILARDGIDENAARKRLASAKSTDFFRKRCDYLLENDGGQAEFEEKIRAFFKSLCKPHTVRTQKEPT